MWLCYVSDERVTVIDFQMMPLTSMIDKDNGQCKNPIKTYSTTLSIIQHGHMDSDFVMTSLSWETLSLIFGDG